MGQTNHSGAVSGLLRAWGRGDCRRATTWCLSSIASSGAAPAPIFGGNAAITPCSRRRWSTRRSCDCRPGAGGVAGSCALLRHRRKDNAEDSGRSRARASGKKRQGAAIRVALDDDVGSVTSADCELLSLDLALDELASPDARQGSDRRAPLLRRSVRTGGRGRAVALTRDCHARVAVRPLVALSSDDGWLRGWYAGSCQTAVVTGGRRPVQDQPDRGQARIVHERVHQKPLAIGETMYCAPKTTAGTVPIRAGKSGTGVPTCTDSPRPAVRTGTAISVPSSAM